MKNDSVFIYRNGIADFLKHVKVDGSSPKHISIQVKNDDEKSHVGDVLSSLTCFGNVKLTKPPTFIQESSLVKIDPMDAFVSIVKQFAGTKVVVNLDKHVVKGILAGLTEVQEVSIDGSVIMHKYINIFDEEAGMSGYNVLDIVSFNFLEESDKKIYKNALLKNYKKGLNESIPVEFTLESNSGQDEDAVVQYALTVAPWNMSYRLNRGKDNKWNLKSYAVVHNSTNFDWNDTVVSVVTGDPITFKHDLALRSEARRNCIHLGQYSNAGLQNSAKPQNAFMNASIGAMPRNMNKQVFSKMVSSEDLCANNACVDESLSMNVELREANMVMAESSMVGDFLILTSPEVSTICSQESALVPMFEIPLTKVKKVFYYKVIESLPFPYSCIKFENTTGMPLTKGLASITIDGRNAGQALLEACKPGEVRMLPHSLETGIKVSQEPPKDSESIFAVTIGKGDVFINTRKTTTRVYWVSNNLEEPVSIVFEQPHLNSNSSVVVKKNDVVIDKVEQIPNFVRFTVDGDPKLFFKVTVEVSQEVKTRTEFDYKYFCFMKNSSWFKSNSDFDNVMKLQKEYDETKKTIEDLNKNKNDYTLSQERMNKLIPNLSDQDKIPMSKNLSNLEESIRSIVFDLLPTQEKRLESIQLSIDTELSKLSTQWEVR